jgi:Flp pilus assembly protein TadG
MGWSGKQRSRRRELACQPAFRRGFVLLWVAVILIVLIGFVGLSLDWGKVAFNTHQLQNAADAAALAGAQLVKFNSNGARLRAIALASDNQAENLAVTVVDNPGNAVDGEVVLGRWIRQEHRFFETLEGPTAVKVVGKREGLRDNAPPLSLLFGPVFGTCQTNASRYAIGWSRSSTGSGIICLSEDPSRYPGWTAKGTGLRVTGTSLIDLRGTDAETGEPTIGDIQVNAASERSPWSATKADGGSNEIYAGELNVVGLTNPDANDAAAWAALFADPASPFSVNPYSPPVLDPLADEVPPNVDTMPLGLVNGAPYTGVITDQLVNDYGATLPSGEKQLTLAPGYYPGGINITGANLLLTGGVDAIYAFGGGTNGKSGLVVGGGGSLIAEGVMLYISGDPDNSRGLGVIQYGKVDLAGTAYVQITSRGDAHLPGMGIDGAEGIAIWQDRANDNYAKVAGTSDSAVKGTLYFGYNAVELGGSLSQSGNQVIAGALWVHGTADFNIAYDGRNQIEAYRSILVE